MKKVATKQQAKLRVYNRVKAELEQELKEQGKWVCFFSGILIPENLTWKDVAWHHLKGRDGELISDKKFIRPVANEYHTGDEGYHNKPISTLKDTWWWEGFLARLKEADYDLWYRETLKMDK